MRWAVEIQKTNLERRNLEDLLNGLGFVLVDGIQFPAFTSPEIDACGTVKNVLEIAKRLRDAFTGPAQIDPTFTLGAVIDYSFDPPRRHYILEAQPAMLILSGGDATLTILPPEGLSDSELKRWEEEQAEKNYQARLEHQRSRLEPAFRNPKAAKVLQLLSHDHPSGEIIYKIYELMEGGRRNRNTFHARFGVSKNQFARFGAAVHNPSVTGDWARHAYEKKTNIDNPMSKSEAEQFVREIASEWLKYIRTSEAS